MNFRFHVASIALAGLGSVVVNAVRTSRQEEL